MSKALELAEQSERLADSRLEDEGYEWSVDADVQLRINAAELRRLAAIEQQLEAANERIKELEATHRFANLVRNAVLEEVAVKCDELAAFLKSDQDGGSGGAAICASDIQSMKKE